MNWLYWAPFGAASLHILEEFVYPGGFAAWDRRYRPDFSHTITGRFHVIINGLLLVACYDVWALRSSPQDFVSNVVLNEVYPYDSVTMTDTSQSEISDTLSGFTSAQV
jgi:hypothetical protein